MYNTDRTIKTCVEYLKLIDSHNNTYISIAGGQITLEELRSAIIYASFRKYMIAKRNVQTNGGKNVAKLLNEFISL